METIRITGSHRPAFGVFYREFVRGMLNAAAQTTPGSYNGLRDTAYVGYMQALEDVMAGRIMLCDNTVREGTYGFATPTAYGAARAAYNALEEALTLLDEYAPEGPGAHAHLPGTFGVKEAIRGALAKLEGRKPCERETAPPEPDPTWLIKYPS